jgi:ankyrin repeat protein
MSTYEEAQQLGLIKEIKTEDETVELLKMIKLDDIEGMKELLNRDKSLVQKEDGSGSKETSSLTFLGTPLHFAASHDRHAMITILLEHGANVDSLDLDQYTPLVLAVKHKSHQSIQVRQRITLTL